MAGEQFSLCWDNFHKNMSSGMHALLESEDLVDVTLAVEGKYLKAHKMVLSVCSPYFRELFQMNPCKHPIVFMKDVSYTAMNDLLTFMYQGEVQVNQEHLTTFIKTAEALQIKGLTSDGNNDTTEIPDDHTDDILAKVPHENDIIPKPAPKPKKSISQPPAKRQRTISPGSEKSTPVPVKSDLVTTPEPTHSTEQLIQFKMEPYEVDQSDPGQIESYEENPEDTFVDDGADETQMDDSDYTMLKGEEEPQAGTSGDGMGESQDILKFLRQILRTVTEIKLEVSSLKRSLHRITDQNNVVDELEDVKKFLPVSNIPSLEAFEMYLAVDSERLVRLKKYIATIGGRGAKDHIVRSLARMYSNAMSVNCSWLGLRNNYKVCNLKSVSVLKNHIISEYDMNEKDFDDIAAEWFRHSRQRLSRAK